jgi:hypothetical protein
MGNPILVFSHNYINYNWRPIVEDQLSLLNSSGLYREADRIYYCCFAEKIEELHKFIDLVKSYDSLNKISVVVHPFNDCEKQTLILIENISKNYDDARICYYHTKGVSSLQVHPEMNLNYRDVESWRRLMEYFVIEKWRDTVQKLEDHDNAGCLHATWKSPAFVMTYFSGNFWWSKTSYIRKLPSMKDRENWIGCETWITSIDHKQCNLFFPKRDRSFRVQELYFDPKEYREDLKNIEIKREQIAGSNA